MLFGGFQVVFWWFESADSGISLAGYSVKVQIRGVLTGFVFGSSGIWGKEIFW